VTVEELPQICLFNQKIICNKLRLKCIKLTLIMEDDRFQLFTKAHIAIGQVRKTE
jgi:hypothetical protein